METLKNMQFTIRKILKEERDNIVYDKITHIISPPYVQELVSLGFKGNEITIILERLFDRKLRIYGMDDGGDIFVHPAEGGIFIYYESFDGSDWVVRKLKKGNGEVESYIDPEGYHKISEFRITPDN